MGVPLFAQFATQGVERQRVDDVFFCEPAFAGYAGSEAEETEPPESSSNT